jgi:hypothetical protein
VIDGNKLIEDQEEQKVIYEVRKLNSYGMGLRAIARK